MDYDAVLAQVLVLLQQEKRVAYRVLKRRLQLDDELLADLKDDVIYAKKLAVDEDGRVLVWTGAPVAAVPASPSVPDPARAPLTYTPSYLAEKILTSRSALEGERKPGHRAVCRPQRLYRADPRPRPRSRPKTPRSGSARHDGGRASL
jgi:hypothetical protein